jgi:hypothetical protein
MDTETQMEMAAVITRTQVLVDGRAVIAEEVYALLRGMAICHSLQPGETEPDFDGILEGFRSACAGEPVSLDLEDWGVWEIRSEGLYVF